MSSHTSIECKVCWSLNVYINFVFKIPGCYGDLQAFITQSSKLHFLVSTFMSTMFDVGDFPILTFGNCVLNTEWIRGVWNYTYVFLRFYVFFKIQKHDFLRFLRLLHTFFLEHWVYRAPPHSPVQPLLINFNEHLVGRRCNSSLSHLHQCSHTSVCVGGHSPVSTSWSSGQLVKWSAAAWWLTRRSARLNALHSSYTSDAPIVL